MEFIKKTKNNIDVNIIKTTKFKTTRIQVVFVSKLDEKTLTARALMPYIIKSVSKKYPSRDVLSSYLEEMYSASFNVGVNKITDAHIITFDMNFIDNYYSGLKSVRFEMIATTFIIGLYTKNQPFP